MIAVVIACAAWVPDASAAGPNALFTNDINASASATNPTNITSATPRFSFLNATGVAAAKQRTQVSLDAPDANDVALWHFDTATGTWADSVGTNTITPQGSPTVSTGPFTEFAQAVTVSGTNYATAAANTSLDLANYTVEVWLKAASIPAGGWPALVGKQLTTGTEDENYLLDFDSGAGILEICSTKGNWTSEGCASVSKTAVLDNVWHHIAGTYDGSTLRLYVDGVQVDTTSFAGPIDKAVGAKVWFSRDPTGTLGVPGQIDEVRISKVARSAAEINAHYTNQLPHFFPVWDSDPTDAGVNLACAIGARCPDVTYGSTGTTTRPLALDGTRYYVRQKLKSAAAVWSAWSSYDWFQTDSSPGPTSLFSDNSNASAGSSHAVNITSPTAHFSFVNYGGAAAATKQRTQVTLEAPDANDVAMWHFDTSEGTWVDSVGGHTATQVGSPTATGGPNAQFAQAVSVSSSNYATIPASSSLDLPNYTVEAWIKSPGLSGSWPTIVGKQTPSIASNFMLDFDSGSVNVEICSTTGNGSTERCATWPKTAVIDNTWHYVAGTYDGTTLRLYIDGAQVATKALTGPIDTAPGEKIYFSRDPTGPTGFSGALDEIRISKVARSAAEISAHYAAALPHFFPVWDSSPTNAGVAMACAAGARCPDVTYGSTGTTYQPLALNGTRYYVRQKLMPASAVWGPWGSYDWFQTAVNAAPSAPGSLAQYRSNGTTSIATGGYTNDGVGTNVVLSVGVQDPDAGQTLTPWVEVIPSGNTFSATACGSAAAGRFSGSPVAAPAAATPVGASVNVTGLVAGTTYKWRSCVVDQGGLASGWTSFTSPSFTIDTTALTMATPNDGNPAPDIAWQKATNTLSGNWTASAVTGAPVASYDYCFVLGTATNCTTPLAGTNTSGSAAALTQTATGLTLTNGTAYSVCVRVTDTAGNSSGYVCSNDVTVDTTALTMPTPNDGNPAPDIDWQSATTTLSANWSAPGAGGAPVATYTYCFVLGTASNCTTPLTGTNATGSGSALNQTATALTLANGTAYSVCVSVTDAAGNTSGFACSDDVTVDTSALAMPTPNDGNPAPDIDWQSATSTLSANWSAPGAGGAPVASYTYCFVLGTATNCSTPLAGTNTSGSAAALTQTATGLTLAAGTAYSVCVSVTDAAGNSSSFVCSDDVTVDTTALTMTTPNDGNPAPDVDWQNSTSTLTANWTAPGAGGAPVASYTYCFVLGTATNCSTPLGGLNTSGSAAALTQTATGLTLANGTAYSTCVSVMDAAGNSSSFVCSDDVTVDTSALAMSTPNDGNPAPDVDWQSSTSTLSANWSAPGAGGAPVASYTYCFVLGSATNCSAPLGGLNTTGSAAALTQTATGLTLAAGTAYSACVSVTDAAGNASSFVCSDDVTVDTTALTMTTPNDGNPAPDIDWQGSTSTLSANWTAPGAGGAPVVSYTYCFVLGSASNCAAPLAGTNTSGTAATLTQAATGLALANGTSYSACVSVTDAAGNTSAFACSDDVTVDTTALTMTTPNDGSPAPDVDWQSSTSTLAGNWTAPAAGGAPVASYDYCFVLGTATNCAAPLAGTNTTNTGVALTQTATGLTLANGTAYSVCVRVIDAAGNASAYVCSDDVTVDTTPLVMPVPNDGATAPDIDWQNSTTTISGNWSAPAAGGAPLQNFDYCFALGTATGCGTPLSPGTNTSGTSPALVQTATGVTLTNSTAYTVCVRARDLAGNVSGYVCSNDVTVDTSALTMTTPNDGVVAPDIDWQSSTTTLVGNWTAPPPSGAPIQDYDYCFTTAAATNCASPLAGTNTSGTAASLTQTATGLALANGSGYSVCVRVRDTSLNLSPYVCSDDVTVDTTAPVLATPLDGASGADVDWQASTSAMDVHWSAPAAGGSPVQDYDYCVTTAAATDCSAPLTGTNASGASPALAQTATALTLTTGTTYRACVRVRDAAGNLGAWMCSNGVTVDSVAPTNAASRNDGVGADIDWQTSLSQLDANFTAGTDGAGSGVADYDWCFTTNAGNSCGAGTVGAVGAVQAGLVAQRTGLALSDATTYFFCVRSRDVAGNVSAYGCTDGVTTDGTAPMVPSSVTDGAGSDIDTQSSTSQLDGRIAGAGDPGGSGVTGYDWCFTTDTSGNCASSVIGAPGTNAAGPAVQVTGATLTPGTTYYLCARAVDAAGNRSVYSCSNGVLVTTAAPDLQFVSNTDAQVGNTHLPNAGATPHLSWRNTSGGTVDRQRTRVLSDVVDSSVVALWHMDAGTGVTTDASGNGHALTLTGAPTGPAGATNFGQALGVDGAGQYATAASAGDLNLASNFTVSTWFNTSSIAANPYGIMVMKSTASGCTVANCNFSLEFDRGAGTLKAQVSNGSVIKKASTSAAPLVDGAWHNAVMTLDAGNNISLYVDGVQQGAAVPAGGPAVNTSVGVAIGSNPASNYGFQGMVDDVEIVSRALSSAEILGYYRTSRPHGDVLWDSDTSDTGVTLGSSCADNVRCPDVVYGATGTPAALTLTGARYYAQQKQRMGAGPWSSWSTADWFETGANVAPTAPSGASLAQFRADGTTAIASGGFTTDGSFSNLVLAFSASDPDPGQTLTPWVEIVPSSGSFGAACGAVVPGSTFAGAAVNAPVGGTAYAATVAVSGLAPDTGYMWRACSVDQDAAAGSWTARGSVPDLQIDLTAIAPSGVADGTGSDIDFTPSPTAVSGTWTAGTDAGGSGVAGYDWCVATTASCATQIAGASVSAAVNSFTQGSLSLTAGQTYYVCVRTVDAVGNQSSYACSDGQTVMTVQSATPANIAAGSAGVTVQITGTGFESGTPTVLVWGTGVTQTATPTWVSPTLITVDVDVAGNATTSARNVTVTNPDGSSALGTAVLNIVAPNLTVGTTTLGYEDTGRTAGGGVSFGTFSPGTPRDVGPAGSGQAVPGPAVELTLTADVTAQITAQASAFTGPGPLAVASMQFRVSGSTGGFTAFSSSADPIETGIPIGTTVHDWDLRLDVPASTTAGAYASTATYTVLSEL